MDRYEKGVLLGKGTFATVYKATDKKVLAAAGRQLDAACACGICVPPPHQVALADAPAWVVMPYMLSLATCRRATLWLSRTFM
jgi:serine/threonine protein kinase